MLLLNLPEKRHQRLDPDPANAKMILATLVVVAAVANLPLAMANVALPSIGKYFNASQIQLNLVAVAYSLGLACSVLWLGALGDRYGRKMMAIIGVSLAIPAALISGFAPTIQVLFFGRLFGGFTAGMAYPTTLALIAALWGPGPARTRSIAMWAALGGAISVSGPLLAGIILKYTEWPWVFFIVIPLAVVALFLALRNIPAHVNETTEQVDNFGGILSVILVGTFVLAINFITMAQYKTMAIELLVVAAIAAVVFIIRQRRAKYPLYDLKLAARPTFWVAAVAGIIIFGSLMGAMFIGQQYMQDVLGFGTVQSALPALFAGACMILTAPRSAKMVESIGSRATLLRGYVFILIAFLIMLFFWKEGTSFWVVVIAFMFVGVGIGLSGTPASRSLTGSVPAIKAGMASGTADLQRDLGGAIFIRSSVRSGSRLRGCDVRCDRCRSARCGGSTCRHQRPDHVLCGRTVGGGRIPAICRSDHGRSKNLLPGWRCPGVYGRYHRGADWCGFGVFRVPEGG